MKTAVSLNEVLLFFQRSEVRQRDVGPGRTHQDRRLWHVQGERVWREPGHHQQRPLALLRLGDVVDDLHGLDVGLEFDHARVAVDVEDVLGVRLHDGVLDDVVGGLCDFVHRLWKRRFVFKVNDVCV